MYMVHHCGYYTWSEVPFNLAARFPVSLPSTWVTRGPPIPVCLLVGFAGGRVRERFVTLPAGEGLFPRVDADVPFEVASVCELLAAVLRTDVQNRAVPTEPRATQGRSGELLPDLPYLTLVCDRTVCFRLCSVAVGA